MKETLKRWFDIFLVLIFSSLIIFAIFSLIIQFSISNWLYQQHWGLQLVIIFLVSALLWEVIYRTGGIRRSDLNLIKYFRFPSIWVTSILLCLIPLIIGVLFGSDIANQILINVSIFLLACFVVACTHFALKASNSKKFNVENTISDRDSILNDPKKIIGWINTETPIEDEAEDLFNHKYVAQKVRDIINNKNNTNIGIIGGYGSGKSSIINLIISRKIENEIICKIEGWGFRENTAVEHILQLIIEELKLHIDCLSVSNLPKQYHQAMNSSGNNVLSILSCFFQGTRNPQKILRKIDTILECIDKKLIIVLEDIDRNINDETFYNEIAAFLSVTKNFNRISFIIAIGPKNNLDAILTRLCEYNEYLQAIDKKEVISVTNKLIEHWHDLWPNDTTICDHKDIVTSLGIPANDREEYAYRLARLKRLIDHIYQLLDTPRKLKTTLRETDNLWSKLHGEVDFRSCFLATILRTSAPEAYQFINENISNLRNVSLNSSHNSKEKDDQRRKKLIARWEQITENVSWHVESAKKIIFFLFQGLELENVQNRNYLIHEKTLQGFIDDSITDYWKRTNFGRLLPNEIGDQIVLRAIEDWRKNNSKKTFIHNGKNLTLPDAIFEIDRFDDKFEQFGYLLEEKEIRELASVLFEKALKKEGNKASQELCPGFINLWRLSLKKDYSEHEDWLINEIDKALNVSFHFAMDLYYYWRHRSSSDVDVKKPTPELRKRYINLFHMKYNSNGKRLASILDQSHPWGLYHLVYYHRCETTEEWDWLGNVLLDASTVNERLLASYIACLISPDSNLVHDSKNDIRDYWKCKISFDYLKEIFGDGIRAVIKLLSKDFEYPELADNSRHGQTNAVIQNAREEARRWLNENPDNKKD